jgi:menaquinone reductase, iron-sulfur cluster-binding subunit
MNMPAKKSRRYGMVIDIDRCTGCGACMMACAAENNVPPAHPNATDRTGITPIRVFQIDNGERAFERRRVRFLPVTCMHCDHETPCQTVCPQQAVELDKFTGIVDQMPQRCLGCRYCMAACPYHARYFNWWDPEWPAGAEATLNPAVSPRMRGVVEKCNFCHARLHAAEDKAAASGQTDIDPADYVPACVEACPTGAITFGDLADANTEVARLARNSHSFRLLARLGTEPKVYYHSEQEWVRRLSERAGAAPPAEVTNG